MTKPTETLQLLEVSGDIPWGAIQHRQLLPEKKWLSPDTSKYSVLDQWLRQRQPQTFLEEDYLREAIVRLTDAREMCLESILLANGLRYAIIRDLQSGDESFSGHEYYPSPINNKRSATTPAKAIHGTDLGDGHRLNMIIAEKPSDERPAILESWVSKKVSGHHLEYEIDPRQKKFGGSYKCLLGGESTNIVMNAEHEEKFFPEISFIVCIGDIETRDQVNFAFDEKGALKEIQCAGMSLLEVEGSYREIMALSRASQRGVVVLKGAGLIGGQARLAASKFLGVEFDDQLALDTKQTLNNLIHNIDTENPVDPKALLSFVGQTKKLTIGRLLLP